MQSTPLPVADGDWEAKEEQDLAIKQAQRELGFTDDEVVFCRRFFDASDRDRSGLMESDELRRVMKGMGLDTDGEEWEAIYAQFRKGDESDGNPDSAIDFPQFLRFVRELGDGTAFNRMATGSGNPHKNVRIEAALRLRLFSPDSPWRWAWNALTMFCGTGLALMAAHYMHRNRAGNATRPVELCGEIVASGVLLIDVALCCYTAHFDKSQAILCDRFGPVMRLYAKSWLFPDLIGAIPWALFFDPESWWRVVRWLR
eukprot:gene5504-16743_t